MLIRFSKIALVSACSFFFLLVVFNNLTDYGSNFRFVEAVVSMSTTFDRNVAIWRAIDTPFIHHVFYWIIILWEFEAMLLLGVGAWRLWHNKSEPAAIFNKSKEAAILGFTSALLLWFGAFIIIGGEWFLMWQSKIYNGQNAAFRMFTIMGILLLYLAIKDEEISDGSAL